MRLCPNKRGPRCCLPFDAVRIQKTPSMSQRKGPSPTLMAPPFQTIICSFKEMLKYFPMSSFDKKLEYILVTKIL